ncbi:MAG TPA: ABC transporter permease [Vicinamibacterales bacterium]|nr:ABC transporter permease [Vicinamibacterales bacterium]
MTIDRLVRLCARSYAQLLLALRVRDSRERRAMGEDGERMLNAAHARGRVTLATTWFALLWDLVFVGARHDLAQALRSLVRSPAVTVGISFLLGLGVAATTTLFAFVDAALLRPLPYDQPDRLVMMWESNVSQDRLREGPSPGNVVDWVARNDAFDAITASMTVSATLRGRDGGTPITGVHVTRGFFDVHRRQPRLGRTFHADEFEGAASITSRQASSGEPVLVLSHHLWQTLGADPQVVGRTVYVEGRDWRVIGVMPEDFAVPDTAAAFWAPWDMPVSYRPRFPNGPPRDARFLRVVGRMKAGMSIEGAEARMQTLASGLASEHPDTNAGWSVRLSPLADEIARTSRVELLLVFAAMSCLLLLVCANVASLAIARGVARAREMAIRLALGARGSRVTRQLIAESVLSAIVTMVIAILLTAWWVDAALSIAPAGIPRMHEVAMNARVASFAAVLALLVTAVGNAVPTFRASRTPIAGALKDGVAVSARASGRLRAGLVVAEIAAAVMLLVGAGLLVRTFAELRRVDVGFDTSSLLVLRITPDAARYRTAAQTTDYYRRVLNSLREVPAIESVAAVTTLPMSTIGSDFTRPYWPEPARPEGKSVSDASIRMATPGYFGTLRLPLIAGREFTDRDDADAPRVVIINQKLARNAWGTENPVGRHLILDYQRGPYPYEVVGVVRDARFDGPRSEPVPEIFIPHSQNPYLVLNVIARTTLDPVAVARTARTYALRVDPDQPIHSVTTMDQLLGDAVQLDRFAMLLITLFAVGGLITAAGGVYALLAYTVVQRRRDIALRMALGASPRRVARSIVMESLVLAVAGGTIGIVGAAASSRFARTLLFGVAPQDPVTLVTALAVLLVVVVAASWLPARRAARIDPARAMRI